MKQENGWMDECKGFIHSSSFLGLERNKKIAAGTRTAGKQQQRISSQHKSNCIEVLRQFRAETE
jgi:hypothetical protein